MKYPTLDVYFHMRNHYRKLRFAKPTIDTSSPKGRSVENYGHRSHSNEMNYSESLNSAHYPYHSFGLKKHECGNNHSYDDHNHRSHSTPCRPVTRRNPADMPNIKENDPKTNRELSIKQFVGPANYKLKKKDGKGDNGYVDSARDKSANGRKAVKNQTCTQDNTYGKKAESKSKNEGKIQTRPDTKKICDSEKDSTISKWCNPNSDCYKNSPAKKNHSVCPTKDSSAFEHEYLEFSLRITEDIIRNDLYTNTEMRRVFNSHIEANRGRLNMDKMKQQIEELTVQLNIPYDDQIFVPNCHENANKQTVRKTCECNQNKLCECGSVRCLPYNCAMPLNNDHERTGKASSAIVSQNEIEICTDQNTDTPQNAAKTSPKTPKSPSKADAVTPKKQDTPRPKQQSKPAKKTKKLKSPRHNKLEKRSIPSEDVKSKPDSSKNEEIATSRTNESLPADQSMETRVLKSAHHPKKSSKSPVHARKKSKHSGVKSDDESIGAKESKGQQRKANSPNRRKKTSKGHFQNLPIVPVKSLANKCVSGQFDICSEECCNFTVDVILQSDEIKHAINTSEKVMESKIKSKPGDEQAAIDNDLSTQCNFFEQTTSEIYTLFPCGMTPNMLQANKADIEQYFIVPTPRYVPKPVFNTGTCLCMSRSHNDDQVHTQMEEMGHEKLHKSRTRSSAKTYTHANAEVNTQMSEVVTNWYVPKTVVNPSTCLCMSRTHTNDQVYTEMEEIGKKKLYEKLRTCPGPCTSSKSRTHTNNQVPTHISQTVTRPDVNENLPPPDLFYAPPKHQNLNLSCEICKTNEMTPEKEYVPRSAKRKVCKSNTCENKNLESVRMKDDLLLSNEYESGLPPSISKFFPSISTQTKSSDFIMIDKIFEANYLASNAEACKMLESLHSLRHTEIEMDKFPSLTGKPTLSDIEPATPLIIGDVVIPPRSHSDNVNDNDSDIATDNAKDNAKDITKDNAKDNGKDNAKDNSKDNSKDITNDDTNDDTNNEDNTNDKELDTTDEELTEKQQSSAEEIITDDLDSGESHADGADDLDQSAVGSGIDVKNFFQSNSNMKNQKNTSITSDESNDDDFMKKLDYQPKMSMTPSMEKGIKKVQHDSEVFRRPEERRISWGGEAGIDISVGIATVIEDEEVEQDEDQGTLIDESVDSPINDSSKKKLRDEGSTLLNADDIKYFASAHNAGNTPK